jgi:hypothetical protein
MHGEQRINAWRAKDKRLFTIQNPERPKTL